MAFRPAERPELFTPDLYPAGPPLEPAPPPGPGPEAIATDLARVGSDATGWYGDPALIARVPDDRLRAGVAALAPTIGAPLLGWLAAGDCPVRTITWGDPGGTRIAGLAGDDHDDPGHRVVNDRYRDEHPFLLTGSILHQLCWNPAATSHVAEALLHGLLAVAHAQLVGRLPALVGTTELARRQQSLVLSLLCSRPTAGPGAERVRIIAPDGPGTLPGGDAAMQTPDLWSIPFAPGDEPVPAPETLGLVLAPWLGTPDAEVDLSSFSRGLVEQVDVQALDRLLPAATADRVLARLGVRPG